MRKLGLFLTIFLIWKSNIFSQTVIANYTFNEISSYPVVASTTATEISSSINGTETFQTYSGTTTGTQAFISNSTAGDALSMSNSSGTNSRYWTVALSGNDLENYKSYKIYLQARRSSTGAQKITLYYSTDGTTFSTFAFMNTGNDVFVEYIFDLSNITNIDLQSTVYFKLAASEATGTGTLRIDNLQIQAIKVINNVSQSFSTDTLYVHDRLKIGNSIIFDHQNNSMFTDDTNPTELNIQSVSGLNHNTIINNNNTGNVGIGTSAPNDKLDLYGTLRTGNEIGYVRTGFNSLHSFIDGYDTLSDGGLLINYYSGENTTIGCDGTGGRYGNFITNNDTKLAFKNGSVAIGGNSNHANLITFGDVFLNKIKASTGSVDFVTIDEYGILHNQTAPELCGTITCENNRIGIGTNAPSQKLEIEHQDTTGGISINQTIAGLNATSEIKFNKNGQQKWAFGNDIRRTGKQTFFIWDHVNGATRFFIDTTGYVGLGNENPSQKLDVSGNIICNKMGINEAIPENDTSIYRLFVDGGIKTRDVKITGSGWADYVFYDDYKLMPIAELEKFINKNKHLPGIPSAMEIEHEKGYEIGDMQKKLMEKLEEQALYIISLQKQVDELRSEIKNSNRK